MEYFLKPSPVALDIIAFSCVLFSTRSNVRSGKKSQTRKPTTKKKNFSGSFSFGISLWHIVKSFKSEGCCCSTNLFHITNRSGILYHRFSRRTCWFHFPDWKDLLIENKNNDDKKTQQKQNKMGLKLYIRGTQTSPMISVHMSVFCFAGIWQVLSSLEKKNDAFFFSEGLLIYLNSYLLAKMIFHSWSFENILSLSHLKFEFFKNRIHIFIYQPEIQSNTTTNVVIYGALLKFLSKYKIRLFT